jgi:CHAT domain-containing protein/tetratricopeptide (TPR) repeat protein
MRLVAVVVALALTVSCARTSEPSLDEMIADAEVKLRRGQLASASELVDRGLADPRVTAESLAAWDFQLLKAEILIGRQEVAEALRLLEAPVPAGRELDRVRGRQVLLRAQASVNQGKLDSAQELLEKVPTVAPEDRELHLDAELLGGQIQFRKGQWATGEARLTAAAAAAAGARDVYRQARALNDLGMSYVVRNRFDEGLAWFERVLALDDLDGTTVYGQSLNNAGLCLARLGQFETAEIFQRRASEIHSTGRIRSYVEALGELGNTYMLQSDYGRAVPQLQQAFKIASEAGLNREATLWAMNLAAAHVYLEKWDDAERFNAEARRLNPPNQPVGELFVAVTDAQIAAGRGRRNDARGGFEAVLAKADKDQIVRFIAYDGLSRLSLESGRPREAATHFEAALSAVERTRADLLRTDSKLSFLSRRINFYHAYVDALVSEGRVDRALEVADSSRGRVMAERQNVEAPPSVTAASFRTLARDTRSVLLFYWLAPRQSRVWVVTGDGVRVEPLPPASEIEKLVADHQSAIQNALADPLASGATAGDRLYQALVAPVQSHIPPGASVVIVPDGALGRINFETLTTGEGTERGKHYWIEDVTIQIAPALALLQRQVSRPTPSSLLLVGNPMPRAPEFPALSYASAEMSGIARHFGAERVTALAGEQATPEAFRKVASDRFSAIHFTTHAVASVESPLDSAVILSGPDQGYKLYARDVAAMPLAADLVTVSACRSAGERAYTGEGLVGFAWAFLRAGSRRVVAGLWDVDDRSTATLMDEVYARIAKGTPPAAALREAKLSLIRQGFPKPYYWAPFQLFTVVL